MMFASLSTPLLLALAGVVGLLIGLLVSTLFRSDPKPNIEESPLPKKYVDQGFAQAACLYYSPAVKKAITELDGDFYADFSALTPEQKKRVLRILQAWQEWSGNSQVSPVQAGTPLQQQPVLTGSIASTAAPDLLPLSPIKSSTVVAAKGKGPASVAPQKPVEPKSIVEQINDVLEAMLVNTPDQQRAIHLTDNGHEGVLVWVGLEKFNGVDEVPYPEVQQLIRTAVTKWEEQAEERNKAMNVPPKK